MPSKRFGSVLRLQSNKSKEEERNSIPEETNAEPLNDEALETVSGGRRLEISFDLNKKSELQDPGRKK